MKKTDTSLTERIFAMVLSVLMMLCIFPVQAITAYAAADYTVNFTVTDKNTNAPLESAEIQIGEESKGETDENGRLSVPISGEVGAELAATVSANHFKAETISITLGEESVLNESAALSEDNPVKVEGINETYDSAKEDGFDAVKVIDPAGCTLTYSLDGETYGEMPKLIDAGEYTVYVKATAEDGFAFSPFTVKSVIGKAKISDIQIKIKSDLVYDKDGVDAIESIDGLVNEDEITYTEGSAELEKYTYTGEVKPLKLFSAGTHTITITVERKNYFFEESVTVEVSSGKSTLCFANSNFNEKDNVVFSFGQEANTKEKIEAFAVETESDGEVSYKVEGLYAPDGDASGIAEINEEGTLSIKKAGEVRVTVTQAATDNYEESSISIIVFLKVDPEAPTLAFPETEKVEYVLQDNSEIVTRAAKKLFEGDSGEITYSLSCDDTLEGESINPTEFLAVEEGSENEGRVSIIDVEKLTEILETKDITVTVTANKETVEQGDVEYYHTDSAQYSICLSMAEVDRKFNIEGNKNENGWYTGTVTISSKDGYMVSLKPWGFSNFQNTIELKDSGIYTDLKVYWREKGMLVPKGIELPEIKIDNNAPKIGEIKYNVSPVSNVIRYITLGAKPQEVEVSVKVTDEHSGIDRVEFELLDDIGETVIKKETGTELDEYVEAAFTVKTDDVNKDIIGHVRVTAYDKVGNKGVAEDEDVQILMDNTAPEIRMWFLNEGEYIEISGDRTFCFEKDTEVYFEVEEANFGIQLNDRNGKNNEFKAQITQTAYGEDAGKPLDVDVSWTLKEEGIYESSHYRVPAGGNVYTLSVDYTDIGGNQVKSKRSFVFDNTAPVLEPKYSVDGNITSAPVRFTNTEEVTVSFTVTEQYLDRAEFENGIEIKKNGEEFDIPQSQFIWGEVSNPDTPDAKATVSFTLSEEGDYSVDVAYADPAGNKMEPYSSGEFTIDRTNPEVSVACEKIIKDDTENKIKYYNAPIEATITITEDTFFEGKEVNGTVIHGAVVLVTKTSADGTVTKTEYLPEGANPKYPDFIQKNISWDETGTTSIKLEDDAYYVLSVEYTDPCGNGPVSAATDTMVVDKTAPIVTVTYNAPVQKANDCAYYNGNIQGTITVKETNFFPEDFHIWVNDTDYSAHVTWTAQSADEHVGVFMLGGDNDYEITMSYADRSNNAMPAHTSGRMTIDTQTPVITLNGVRHQSANNKDTITLTVSVVDKNISMDEFEAILSAVTKRDMGKNSYRYESEKIALGQKHVTTNAEGETVYSYTIDNLPLDGYYTLTAVATDYAGHTVDLINTEVDNGESASLAAVNFSVNREGSVFWIETEHSDKYTGETLINELNGAYANDEVKVAVHEVNVDPVDTMKGFETLFTLNDGSRMTEIALNDSQGGNYVKNQSVGKGGWYENIYTLDNSYFEKDGTYSLNLITYDTASNSNVNTKDDNGIISFILDRTQPVITSNIISGQSVRANEHVVEFRITEANLNPETISVTLDGERVEPEALGNNEYRFTVGSGYGHVVEISAGDMANNASEPYVVSPFTVSTNVFVLWFANKLLFWGSLLGVAVLGGFLGLLLTRRKRNEKSKV